MPTTMLLRKLEQVMVLSETERQIISELPERVLHVKPREDIVDTSRPTSVRLIRTGIACRYTLLGNGHRQITAFLVPSDFCDLRALIMGDMITQCRPSVSVSWQLCHIIGCLLPSRTTRV